MSGETSTDPGDYSGTDYTKPVQSQDTGWFGDAYANEGDPSWEDVIAMVVIPGSPARIKQASGEWSALLTRLSEVERVLKAIKTDLETWKGAGGDQYRSHLDAMITSVGQIRDANTTLPHHLDLAASDLDAAIAKIPIPDDMIAEVMAAKQGYIDSGMISDTWGPNAIYQHLLPVYGNKWFDEAREFFTWDWASNKLRDWISSQDDKAKDAYKQLAGQHVNTMALINASNPAQFQDPRDLGFTPDDFKGGGGGGGGGGGMPNTKMPGTDPKLGGGPGIGGMNGPPSSNLTDPSMTGPSYGDTAGYDPGDLPGSGLAGAGGGLTGAGPGAGGLGGGFGSGPGSGGLGSGGLGGLGSGGGLGAGGAGRVPGAGGMGGMMPGMAGGAGGARGAGRGVAGAGAGKGGVRGAGGAGAGRSAAGGLRGGMMPGGAGQGAGGDGEDHATWLQEDDDPWGSDSEAPPSVLG